MPPRPFPNSNFSSVLQQHEGGREAARGGRGGGGGGLKSKFRFFPPSFLLCHALLLLLLLPFPIWFLASSTPSPSPPFFCLRNFPSSPFLPPPYASDSAASATNTCFLPRNNMKEAKNECAHFPFTAQCCKHEKVSPVHDSTLLLLLLLLLCSWMSNRSSFLLPPSLPPGLFAVATEEDRRRRRDPLSQSASGCRRNGPWRRRWHQRGGGPLSYWIDKKVHLFISLFPAPHPRYIWKDLPRSEKTFFC